MGEWVVAGSGGLALFLFCKRDLNKLGCTNLQIRTFLPGCINHGVMTGKGSVQTGGTH